MTAYRIDDPGTRPASFDAALTEAIPKLRRFARRLTARDGRDDPDMAEELLNDTVLYALRVLKNYRPADASIGTWANWLMRSEAKRGRMRRCREEGLVDRRARIVDTPPDETEGGSYVMPVAAGSADETAYLRQIVGGLAEVKQAETLVLWMHGHELLEIADIQGLNSRQAAHNRLKAARRELAEVHSFKAADGMAA